MSPNTANMSLLYRKNRCVPPWPIVNTVLMWLQTLYSGTVRFNVLLGATKPASEVTQEEIEEACRNANILDFIQSLPEYVFSLTQRIHAVFNTKHLVGLTRKLAEKALSCPVARSVRCIPSHYLQCVCKGLTDICQNVLLSRGHY